MIWGASGHARVVADIVRLQGDYEIVGFLDDVNPQRRNIEFCGAKILGGQEQLERLRRAKVKTLIIAIGDCQARLNLSEFAREKKFHFATAIHPSATVASDVEVGVGTVVAAGAVASAASKIGDNAIINTCASVDHECRIGEGVHIAPGARLASRVTVGRGSWVGIGSIVKERVRIGKNSIVGAGAVVLEDVPDNVVAYGSPAKVVRKVPHRRFPKSLNDAHKWGV